MIQAYKSHTPKIAKTAYVHPSAVIIGDVTIGEYTNIWPGAVLRGDLQPIVVGDYTNIQDNVNCSCNEQCTYLYWQLCYYRS